MHTKSPHPNPLSNGERGQEFLLKDLKIEKNQTINLIV